MKKNTVLAALAAITLLSSIEYKQTIKQDQTDHSYSIVESATHKPAETQRLKVEDMKAIATESQDIYLLESSIYPGTFFHASHLLDGATYEVRWNEYGLLSIEAVSDPAWTLEFPDKYETLEFKPNAVNEL